MNKIMCEYSYNHIIKIFIYIWFDISIQKIILYVLFSYTPSNVFEIVMVKVL